MNRLKELARLFLKLGLITFGGPAVHIAIFEDEVVTRRKWMTRQHFLDLVGATNLIPGPNSTEMAIHCGFHRAGIAGALVAGVSFTLPAVLITGIIAYFYSLYGNLPSAQPFLYGIKPAVIIIILNAVYKLGFKAVNYNPSFFKDRTNIKMTRDFVKFLILCILAVVVVSANFLGLNEITLILAGGIAGGSILYFSERKNFLFSFSPFMVFLLSPIYSFAESIAKSEISLTTLFLSFLKIGAVWFGSGYVLVAYFDGEFVQGLNWLTRQELIDAIAVGQFTPGPFLSSATFIGFQIAGLSGAALATIAITIPAFLFVFILNPIIPRIRKSEFISRLLDAVNVSAVAVMFAVGVKLALEVLVDWQTCLIAILSTIAFFTIKKINAAYIVAGGALAGYLLYLLI
ncbi:MAG TPA: chromate efflux transporter [Melioribacteraceae bacterium]|nr:chromate efflux transporter [Melioribacteraceae bacterium]